MSVGSKVFRLLGKKVFCLLGVDGLHRSAMSWIPGWCTNGVLGQTELHTVRPHLRNKHKTKQQCWAVC